MHIGTRDNGRSGSMVEAFLLLFAVQAIRGFIGLLLVVSTWMETLVATMAIWIRTHLQSRLHPFPSKATSFARLSHGTSERKST